MNSTLLESTLKGIQSRGKVITHEEFYSKFFDEIFYYGVDEVSSTLSSLTADDLSHMQSVFAAEAENPDAEPCPYTYRVDFSKEYPENLKAEKVASYRKDIRKLLDLFTKELQARSRKN